jgi:hypothetical protein
MGMSRARKDEFKRKHPWCIFCGGVAIMTTIEHCPPRAMFQGRHAPEGFEFPACSNCNHGSADDDLIVAFLARINPFEGSDRGDGRFRELAKSIRQKHPGLIEKMFPTATEARRLNKTFGLRAPPGKTQQESGVSKCPAEIHQAIAVFAAKLSKAIYYLETEKIFPENGELVMKWTANSELVSRGGYTLIETLTDLPGVEPVLKRGGTHLNSQFAYKLSMANENEFFAIQAVFGFGFSIVVFGSTTVGEFEDQRKLLQRNFGKTSNFVMIAPRIVQAEPT